MVTVTKELIESKIKSVYYINAGQAIANSQTGSNEQDLTELGLLNICIIVMENGFKEMGKSACVDPAVYNEELGKKYAYEEALDKLWEKEGYLLKQNLHEQAQSQEMLKGFLQEDNCESGACKL